MSWVFLGFNQPLENALVSDEMFLEYQLRYMGTDERGMNDSR
jgi:hypothetical protein